MRDSYDIISSEELSRKIEQDNSNNEIKIAGQKLLDAINDWPGTNIFEIKDFVIELNREIGSPLTYKKIEVYSKNLKVERYAWQMESLSSLLEFFEYDKAKNLEEIIIDINKYYNPK